MYSNGMRVRTYGLRVLSGKECKRGESVPSLGLRSLPLLAPHCIPDRPRPLSNLTPEPSAALELRSRMPGCSGSPFISLTFSSANVRVERGDCDEDVAGISSAGAEIDLSTVSRVASIFLSDLAIASVLRFDLRPRCDSSKMHCTPQGE